MSTPLTAEERQLQRAVQVSRSELSSLRNWFPVTLQNDATEIVWRHMAERFIAPFFLDDFRLQPSPERRYCITSQTQLPKLEPALCPSAFVFHISRCGSTWLSQMLVQHKACIVMSEPPIIDAFFRSRPGKLPSADDLELLRYLIGALGQQRSSRETHFFIKLDSWHIHRLEWFRAAFPDTPCWFLYREPMAVFASHQRQRGAQMVPGVVLPLTAGLPAADLDGFCWQVLYGFYDVALRDAEALQLIHYQQLPDHVVQQLLPTLGLHYNERDWEALHQRRLFHAKQDSAHYVPDTAAEPGSSHPLLQRQVQQRYLALEQRRLAAMTGLTER